MFLNEKQDGSIKGCGVADGRNQREKIKPKDATSPTVSTEVVMLTATIYALEGRGVAVVDIPEAYLSADMDNEVNIVFIGTLVDMMVAADPALYRPFVSYETGKAVLRKELEVSTDIMFINKLLFLVSISRRLDFTTTEDWLHLQIGRCSQSH